MKLNKQCAVLLAMIAALSLLCVNVFATGATTAPVEESTTAQSAEQTTSKNPAQAVGDVADNVAGAVSDIAGAVAGIAGDIADAVGNVAGDVSEAASNVAKDVSEVGQNETEAAAAFEQTPEEPAVPATGDALNELPDGWEAGLGDSSESAVGVGAVFLLALFGLGLPTLVFTVLAIVFLVRYLGNRRELKLLQSRAQQTPAAAQPAAPADRKQP